MGRKPDAVASTKVVVPDPAASRPALGRIGLFAAGGLVVGILWPQLARLDIGPDVPGAKPPAAEAATAEPAETAAEPTAAAAPSAAAAPAGAATRSQTVVVAAGRIERCYRGKDRIEPEQCGALRIDRTLVPRLQQLSGCPSALGLSGELEIGFDIDFSRQLLSVRRGKKSELPSSTVNGILACAADYVRDVEAEKIPHQLDRYQLAYALTFYPPGEAPPRAGRADEQAPADEARRDLATVTWDTALVRDEPSNGKVVARLVRGTRVPILGRRKDWYQVKMGSEQGWVYRGALGL